MKVINNMKIRSITVGVCLLLIGGIIGCDDFERKGKVTPEITVNEPSLNMFVDQTIQLKASPSDLTFTWSCEDNSVATVSGNGLVTAVGEGATFIIVHSGNMTCRVPITAATRIPLRDFVLNKDEIDTNPGMRIEMWFTIDPPNANDASLPDWRSLNNNVATVDYKGVVSGAGEGTTEIICTINGISKSVSVEVWITKPFKGPHILTKDEPYILPAINFDFGGEGNAYHDNDAGNSGNNNYRRDNGDPNGGGVDIGGDLAVGWTGSGEWLLYTIEVKDAGDYIYETEVSANAPSTYRLYVDGVSVFAEEGNPNGAVSLPSDAGWGNWTWRTAPKPITLTEGVHKIRYYFDNAQFNFRTMKFTHSDLFEPPIPPPDPVDVVTEILTTVKDWKIGPWTGMRNPDNRNEVWWDFKDASITDDIFTFNADGSYIHDTKGDSFMNEGLGNLYPDGDPEDSFVTVHYTPAADATWEVSKNSSDQVILTIKKGFLGYATEVNELTQVQYRVTGNYSDEGIRFYLHSGWDGWCWELVPAN